MTNTNTPTPRVRETDMSLSDALAMLNNEQGRKCDVVLSEGSQMEPIVTITDGNPVPEILFGNSVPEIGGESFPIQETAHRQISDKTGVPLAYYRRMIEEAPDLWARNVGHWFGANKKRLVRSFRSNGDDGVVRAFLGRTFKVLDSTPFLTSVLESAGAVDPDIEVLAAHVDDDRVYLKLATSTTQANRRGDIIRQGLAVSNSEVGAGSIKIQPWAVYLACTNGMKSTKNYRQVHLGGELDAGILTRETIEIRAEAVWSEVRDFTSAALSPEHLHRFVEFLDAAEEIEVDVEPRLAVANIVKTYNLNGGQGTSILERYLRDAGTNGETQFGLVQAVTYEAHEADSFRAQEDMEDLGGKLLETGGTEFLRMLNRPVSDRELDRAFTTRAA